MHAAHTGAHDKAKMVDAEMLGQQLVLRMDHIGVAVPRKATAESIRRLARLSMPDAIGEHEEVLIRGEQLARVEESAGEDLLKEI